MTAIIDTTRRLCSLQLFDICFHCCVSLVPIPEFRSAGNASQVMHLQIHKGPHQMKSMFLLLFRLMISELPNHLVEEVLSYLPLIARLNLRVTCRKLDGIFRNSRRLWIGFQLLTPVFEEAEEEKQYCENLIAFFSTVPYDSIAHMFWKLSPDVLQSLLILLERNPESLRAVDIHNEELTDQVVQIITDHLPGTVTHLGIMGSPLLTDSIFQFILNSGCFLNHLDLSYDSLLTDVGFRSFLQHPDNKMKLSAVVLNYISYITDSSISILLELHGHCLKHLHVDGENLPNRVFKEIAKCENLQGLVLNFASGLTDEIFIDLIKLNYPIEICLRKGRKFTSHGISQFLQRGKLQHLQKLNLSECDALSNENLKEVAIFCPNLTHLHIAWCNLIDDEGMFEVIDKCHRMRDMDLSGLDKLRGNHFGLIPFKMPHLEKLKMEMSGAVDERDLHWIVIQMKGQLEVIDFYHQVIVFDPKGRGHFLGFNDINETPTQSIPSIIEELTSDESSSNSACSSEETEDETTDQSVWTKLAKVLKKYRKEKGSEGSRTESEVLTADQHVQIFEDEDGDEQSGSEEL